MWGSGAARSSRGSLRALSSEPGLGCCSRRARGSELREQVAESAANVGRNRVEDVSMTWRKPVATRISAAARSTNAHALP